MFKKVLLGEDKDLDILEQTQWPELGSSGNGKWKNNNSINITIDKKLETSNNAKIDCNKTLPEESSPNTVQANDFPNLIESMSMDVDKRNRLTNCEQYTTSTKVKKCKKIKKTPSRAPLTLDLNMMLNLSIALSEKKQRKKRKRCSLHLQKQILLKVSGNKLDSDCPVRYRGKKRPHRKRKITKIKCSFQRAAMKSLESNHSSWEFKVSLNRLRQSILNGLGKGEQIDDLVNNLGRITLNDIQSEENNEFSSIDCNRTAQSLLHTKNFKSYCNHLPNNELKEKCKELIKTMRIFQDRMHAKDPIKCKSKRRYVCGCREVRKFLRAESVKLILFANNLAVENEMPTILEEILRISADSNIPVIFSGSSFDLGMWTLKKSKTSVIGVLNYEGLETLYKDIIEDLNKAKEDYQQLLQKVSFCLQRKFKGELIDVECLFQEVEEQIRDNIISKLI